MDEGGPYKFATFAIFTRSGDEDRLNSRLAALKVPAKNRPPGRHEEARQQGSVMRKTALIVFLLAATVTSVFAAERPMRFWNLTRHTISEFYLAPAGTTNWGANQCKNDRDGTVDSDERLRITDTSPGRYDARLVDVSKRTCIVRNLELKAGEIFSIEEKELTSCTQ
jgi:hypothetical protein